MIEEVLTIVFKLHMPVLIPFVLLLMALLLSENIISVIRSVVGVRRGRG